MSTKYIYIVFSLTMTWITYYGMPAYPLVCFRKKIQLIPNNFCSKDVYMDVSRPLFFSRWSSFKYKWSDGLPLLQNCTNASQVDLGLSHNPFFFNNRRDVGTWILLPPLRRLWTPRTALESLSLDKVPQASESQTPDHMRGSRQNSGPALVSAGHWCCLPLGFTVGED